MTASSRRTMTVPAVIIATVALVLFMLPMVAQATPLAQRKAAAQAKVAKVRSELDALHTSLEKAIQKYDLANLKLQTAEDNVVAATHKLSVAQYRLDVGRAQLEDRVAAMYKERPLDLLDVVFSARELQRHRLHPGGGSTTGASNAALVTALQNAVDKVRQERDALLQARLEARTYLGQVAARKGTIQSALDQQNQIYASARAQVKRIQKEAAAAAAAARAAAAAAAAQIPSTAGANPRAFTGNPGKGHPEVIAIARNYLGIPYVYGAARPHAASTAPASSCTATPRSASAAPLLRVPAEPGRPVPMNALIPGDLVFMGTPSPTTSRCMPAMAR